MPLRARLGWSIGHSDRGRVPILHVDPVAVVQWVAY